MRPSPRVIAAIFPVGWVVATILPFMLAWHRLPDPMGQPWAIPSGGSQSRLAFVTLWGALAAISALNARRARGWQLGGATFLGLLSASSTGLVVALNLDAPDWQAARSIPTLWVLAGIAVLAGVSACVGYVAHQRDKQTQVA